MNHFETELLITLTDFDLNFDKEIFVDMPFKHVATSYLFSLIRVFGVGLEVGLDFTHDRCGSIIL